ncbi:MAG: PhzF family phenazine biosynthesis protein [Verrucomicrobiota bacterium]
MVSIGCGRHDLVAEVADETSLATLAPDFRAIAELPHRGVLATARGDEVDFVSRCFFPRCAIDEDPVTGSAHTTLSAWWAPKLEKTRFSARQISARGGELECEICGDRVLIRGHAVTFLRGEIEIG